MLRFTDFFNYHILKSYLAYETYRELEKVNYDMSKIPSEKWKKWMEEDGYYTKLLMCKGYNFTDEMFDGFQDVVERHWIIDPNPTDSYRVVEEHKEAAMFATHSLILLMSSPELKGKYLDYYVSDPEKVPLFNHVAQNINLSQAQRDMYFSLPDKDLYMKALRWNPNNSPSFCDKLYKQETNDEYLSDFAKSGNYYIINKITEMIEQTKNFNEYQETIVRIAFHYNNKEIIDRLMKVVPKENHPNFFVSLYANEYFAEYPDLIQKIIDEREKRPLALLSNYLPQKFYDQAWDDRNSNDDSIDKTLFTNAQIVDKPGFEEEMLKNDHRIRGYSVNPKANRESLKKALEKTASQANISNIWANSKLTTEDIQEGLKKPNPEACIGMLCNLNCTDDQHDFIELYMKSSGNYSKISEYYSE